MVKYFKIGKNKIGKNYKTYFIADIAANHDGNLNKAIKLIKLAAKSGANAAKFQHFKAETIVSDKGFKNLGKKFSHQSKWKKSVFEVYKDASINPAWTPILKKVCNENNIDFFTSPYDLGLVDEVDKYVEAYKIGSGDITWLDILVKIAKKKKPCILASGASTFKDVSLAINTIKKHNKKIVLMQCNTNYTGNESNFKNLNLKVLLQYKKKFPNIILGLSDHTHGCSSVLGAIALGARVIEKHFTDNNNQVGPDHSFSMNPKAWKEMIDRARELEQSLGDGIKKVEINERETIVLQRRSLRYKSDFPKNKKILRTDITPLRPCPLKSITPQHITKVLGKRLKKDVKKHDCVQWKDLKL